MIIRIGMLRTTLKISGDFLTEWILSTVRKGECSSEIAMMISAFYIYFLGAATHDPRPPPKTHDPRHLATLHLITTKSSFSMNFTDTNIIKIKFGRVRLSCWIKGNSTATEKDFCPLERFPLWFFFLLSSNPKANPRIEKIQQYLFSLTLFS